MNDSVTRRQDNSTKLTISCERRASESISLGIFAKVFMRPTVEAVFDAVVAAGFHNVQFNFACAGMPSLPEVIEPAQVSHIRDVALRRKVSLSALSGTFNMIHPDTDLRASGLRRLRVLILASRELGCSTITLCTGTRDPETMWRRHRENDSESAWMDLCQSMEKAIGFAEESRIQLAIEPELANVVDSARKARRLLDEMQSPSLKIVIDPANLFPKGQLPRMKMVLDEAFELLGEHIVLAHAKDLAQDGAAGELAAGTGCLDYDYYLKLLRLARFRGPLILHGLNEDQVTGCRLFLENKLRECVKVQDKPSGGGR